MPPAAFSPLGRAHVLLVRSARPSGCGLAGRAFLNTPWDGEGAWDVWESMRRGRQWLRELGFLFDSIQDECEAPTQ